MSKETYNPVVGDIVRVCEETSPHFNKIVTVHVVPQENGGLPFLRSNNAVIVKEHSKEHTYFLVELLHLSIV